MPDIYDTPDLWNERFSFRSFDTRTISSDVELWRNVSVGGDAVVRGSQLVRGDLLVAGTFAAHEIYGIREIVETYAPAPIRVESEQILDRMAERGECIEGRLYYVPDD